MYNYEWDPKTGGYILTTKMAGITKELRPVFYEELELLGFKNKGWKYPKTEKPLLWAETRRYIYRGRFVAETVGGGLYTAPMLKIHEENLVIDPVDVDNMIMNNKALMDGLVQNTLETIYKTFNEYKNKKIDVFYVAFSGGKDSLVLLDLVQRALPHNEFKVVFGDTSMEMSDTYETIKKAKERWNTLDFIIAKSHLDAKESWKIFGPPSRTQRWCCSVHKSAPSLLKLKELTGKEKLRAFVFDGVRGEESDIRETYSLISEGNKHATQTNYHAILEWNTAELFLYMFENNLFLNNAYKYGIARVGCLICPMSSEWREYVTNSVYPKEVLPFINIIEESLKSKISDTNERRKYINEGGWKGRIDGRDIDLNGNRLIEQDDDSAFSLIINEYQTEWREWIKTLGELIQITNEDFIVIYKSVKYPFKVIKSDAGFVVSINKVPKTKDSIRFLYLFKNVFHKAAYCGACKVCEVECPFGAIKFEERKAMITDKCNHCENCIDMPRGCLVARSKLFITGGRNVKIKGLGNYRGFGFRQEWLQYYIELGDKIWTTDTIGKPKRDALKVWLREADITLNNKLTDLGQEICRLGANDIRVWAVILNNLVYNSAIIRWYTQNVEFNMSYSISDILMLLGDDYKGSTKDNAIASIRETFKFSPIGIELGLGNYETKGKNIISVTRTGWSQPDALVILYSLYKFAEVSEGYYSFTLTDLMNDNAERLGISPAQIFGLDREMLKRLIQGLAWEYREFISVAFNKDLDNIYLNQDKTSLDVVKMF